MLITGERNTSPCFDRGPSAPMLYSARASSPIAPVIVCTSSGSHVAPIAIAAGNKVVGCFDHTPCSVWFHPPHAGTPNRGRPLFRWFNCEAFSSIVIFEIRSAIRCSVGFDGSRYTAFCANAAEQQNRTTKTGIKRLMDSSFVADIRRDLYRPLLLHRSIYCHVKRA